MEDDYYINLGECVFGPDELRVLLREWLKDPRPKTINELARMYWTHRYELQTGFLPYDSRNRYKEGDKITVRLNGKLQPAKVVRVSKNAHHKDGFRCDEIEVRLLSQTAMLKGQETKSFIAHDQAKMWASSAVRSFEVITEKDETELIPKILAAISNDNRFVNFQDLWLPSELLVTDVSAKLTDVRKIIAKCKQALSTGDILEKVHTEDNTEELGNCLEFSLNYFLLELDKRFVRISDPAMKWDLRKPSGPVLVTIDQRTLSDSKLSTTCDLDLLLFYHGFIDQCVFSFPYNREIMAYHHISDGSISGDEFVSELVRLSENKKCKIEFGRPEQRGGTIKVYVSAPTPSEKRQWTVTIDAQWLEEGVLIVPRKLANYMEGTNALHILYDQVDEVLPYEENDRMIEGFNTFYSVKAIAEGDEVHLRIQGLEPTKLFVSSRWQRRLGRLIRLEPVDLRWEQSSLRDCIIVVLAKFKEPAHYREIYSEIAAHKDISLGAVIGTLSRYCPSLFVHAGSSQWWLGGFAVQKIISKYGQSDSPGPIAISEEIWKAVGIIENNDYVYKLLQRIRTPLSFDEICEKLADYLRVDVQELKATGFLKADKRLRRLDNGTWALKEWFKPKSPPQDIPPKETSKLGLFWLLVIILLILLFVSGGSMLIWLLIYRS